MTTIKTPVRVEDLEGSTPWFGSLVEADGNPLLLSDIAAALNATASTPDLTALRTAVDSLHDAVRGMEGERHGTEAWFAARDMARVARADIITLVLDMFTKDGTP